MLFHLLLLAASSAQREDVPSETVLALVGDDVLLPCSYRVPLSDELPTVEWSKNGLQPNVVLLYRDGYETPEMKNLAFKYRTSLATEDLTSGNISLWIGNVRLSDAGRYQCMRLWKKLPRDVTQVELYVGAVSEPKLSVTRLEGGGVALQCEADCWFPEPRISFLDGGGHVIEAAEPKRDQDARGCFSVRRTATPRDASGRFTCRVHQAEINQTREVEETLTDVGGSCLWTGGVCVGVTCLLLSALFGVAFFFWRRSHKCGRGAVSSNKDQESVSLGDRLLLLSGQRAEAENESNAIMEAKELRLKVAALEDTIRQLHNNNNNNSGARLDAVVCHIDCPPPGDVPRAPKRRHSSPPRLSSHAAALLTRPGRLSRSLSDPYAGPDPDPYAGPDLRLQRRHSVASPLRAAFGGRLSSLPHVTEESEMLVPFEEPEDLVWDFTKTLSE